MAEPAKHLRSLVISCMVYRDTEFGRWIKQPDEIGGCETQSAYVVVLDADAIYERARAAGAEMLIDIKDEGYGGRGFTCRDLEGQHLEHRHLRSLATRAGRRVEKGDL